MNFQEKLQAATGQCFVDTAFWGGVVPGNQVKSDPLHITILHPLLILINKILNINMIIVIQHY